MHANLQPNKRLRHAHPCMGESFSLTESKNVASSSRYVVLTKNNLAHAIGKDVMMRQLNIFCARAATWLVIQVLSNL